MRYALAAAMAVALVSWAGTAQASQQSAPLLSDPLALEQVQLDDHASLPEAHQIAQVGVQLYFGGGGYRGGYYGHGHHHHHHGYNRSYNRYYGHGGYYRGGYGGGYRGGYGGGGCRW